MLTQKQRPPQTGRQRRRRTHEGPTFIEARRRLLQDASRSSGQSPVERQVLLGPEALDSS